VELAEGREADPDTLRAWCREHLAHYKVPGRFIFAPIPRTSTGKIQKYVLRDQARSFEEA
jgi:fatty-acyl-CoA synthase